MTAQVFLGRHPRWKQLNNHKLFKTIKECKFSLQSQIILATLRRPTIKQKTLNLYQPKPLQTNYNFSLKVVRPRYTWNLKTFLDRTAAVPRSQIMMMMGS